MSSFVELRHTGATQAARWGFAIAAFSLSACSGDYSALDPKGPAAAHIADLWWVMLAGAAVILAGVVATALYSLRARREARFSDRRVLVGWGLVFPLVTLAALMAFAFLRGETLLARPHPERLTLLATASQWQWTFGYPNGRISEGVLHVPAGETFHVVLRSDDVIHSFWVPQLGGKLDAIPGRENVIALRADQPGLYRGICAEYCGVGHAHMPFAVRAHRPAGYEQLLSTGRAGEGEQELPVLEPRRRPASDVLGDQIGALLRWIGVRP